MELISVIMGIKYRRTETDTLKRAIDSVLCQSYENLELLICERDSTQNAKEMLIRYADSDKRIKLIDGSLTSSFSEQLNLCIKASNGAFIARMDDDDLSLPDRFEKQIRFLNENSDFAFVGSNVALFSDGEIFGHDLFPKEPGVNDFLYSMPFIHPSLIFRRQVFDKVGLYGEQARCNRCEDYDLLLRIYEAGMRGFNIQEELLIYSFPRNRVTTRTLTDRIRETRTRFVRFRSLGLLPGKFFYAIKPLLTAFIPKKVLARLKNRKKKKDEQQ